VDSTHNTPEMPPLAAVLHRYQGIDPALVHLDEAEAAACLGQQAKTLESWRREGKELPFLKIGRAVRYRLSDVLSCIDRNTYSSSREARTRNRSIPQRRQRGRRGAAA
jgi:hypothetical protein